MKDVRAVVLMEEFLDLSERYRVELKVYGIRPSQKYPEGIKARFALVDMIEAAPRLLIDNHAPFGFHVHAELPKNKKARQVLETKDYLVALDEFWRLVGEILKNET